VAISFYMDVHIPSAITDQSRMRNIDVLTAQEDGARRFPDSNLLDRASQLGRILVTQDTDLLVEGSLRQRTAGSFLGVVYAAQAGVTIGKCVEDLELIAKVTEPAEWVNRVEYLPLK